MQAAVKRSTLQKDTCLLIFSELSPFFYEKSDAKLQVQRLTFFQVVVTFQSIDKFNCGPNFFKCSQNAIFT